jgi:hypothetical protein
MASIVVTKATAFSPTLPPEPLKKVVGFNGPNPEQLPTNFTVPIVFVPAGSGAVIESTVTFPLTCCVSGKLETLTEPVTI